jgi:hypothetical protein
MRNSTSGSAVKTCGIEPRKIRKHGESKPEIWHYFTYEGRQDNAKVITLQSK